MPNNNKKKNSARQKKQIILSTNNPVIKITNVEKAQRNYYPTPELDKKVQAIHPEWSEFRKNVTVTSHIFHDLLTAFSDTFRTSNSMKFRILA